MKLYKVEIEHDAGDGFELLDTFTPKADSPEDAIHAAYEMAREQYPEIGDMNLRAVNRIKN